MRTARRSLPALAALALFVAAGASARDAGRGERVLGDDDPLVVPAPLYPPSSEPALAAGPSFDPETTGSLRATRKNSGCRRLAVFVDREPEDRVKPVC